jgi:hypothetical protein
MPRVMLEEVLKPISGHLFVKLSRKRQKELAFLLMYGNAGPEK